jgi:hypothetical protein
MSTRPTIGSTEDIQAEHEATERGEWFALSGVDGRIYSLGECSDFDQADDRAKDRGLDTVWIASPYVAEAWRQALRPATMLVSDGGPFRQASVGELHAIIGRAIGEGDER